MSDAHIHAFVDRQLKREREERLQELVADWPEKYEQIQEYQLINQRLLDGLADVYDQTIPDWITQVLKGTNLQGRPSRVTPSEKVKAKKIPKRKNNPIKQDDPARHTEQESVKQKDRKRVTPKQTVQEKSIPRENSVAEILPANDTKKKDDVKPGAVEIIVEPDGDSEATEIRELDIDLPRHFRFTAVNDMLSSGAARLKNLASGNLKVVASIIVGGIIGWTTHNVVNAYVRGNSPEVAQSAIDAHVFYSAESKHAVEINAKHKKQLRNWIKSKLKTELEPVNLKKYGYELMGGRILPVKGKLAGQYMYENTGDASRLTIYMSAYLQDTSGIKLKCEIVEISSDLPLSACGWRKENIVYYVISNKPIPTMQKISMRVKSLMPKK